MLTSRKPKDLPSLIAKAPESHRLLGRQVDDDESIGPGLFSVIEHPFLAILKHWIVVSHKQHRSLETSPSGLAKQVQNCSNIDTIGKGLRVGSLNCRSIRNWISKRQSEFNNIYRIVTIAWSAHDFKRRQGKMMDCIPAPPFSKAKRMSTLSSTVGYPAVT